MPLTALQVLRASRDVPAQQSRLLPPGSPCRLPCPCLAAPLPPCAVVITLRNDTNYNLAWLHDLEIRVGSSAPGVVAAASGASGAAPRSPDAVNLRCTLAAGRLGTARGQRLRLACTGGAKTGRYLSLQIR
jgi:hypothetical protein